FPVHVPSVTNERKCGSGQQAIEFAAQGIAVGQYDVVIAPGVESMSRVPMGTSRMDAHASGPRVRSRFPLGPQRLSAAPGGQQASELAAPGSAVGRSARAIAAGVESMRRVPMGPSRRDAGAYGPGVRSRFTLVPQGVSAELVAERFGLSRLEQDLFSGESHR